MQFFGLSFCCILLVFFPGSPGSAPWSLLRRSSKISACLPLTRLSCVPGLGDAEQHELWLCEEVLLQRRKNQLEGQLRIFPHEFLALAECRSRSGALLTYDSSSMLACGAHVEDQEVLSRKPRHFPAFSSTALRLLSFQPRSGHHHFPSRPQFPGKRAWRVHLLTGKSDQL